MRRGNPRADGRRGFSLFEGLIALALFSVLLIVIGPIFSKLMGRDGPMSINVGASRSLVAQQSRMAIRKLFYRLQEGIQIISPLPGVTAGELVIRDMRNRQVRVVGIAAEKKLVTERLQPDGSWVRESTLPHEASDSDGIVIPFCEDVQFTAITPGAVCVSFSSFDDRVKESFMTVIALANARLVR